MLVQAISTEFGRQQVQPELDVRFSTYGANKGFDQSRVESGASTRQMSKVNEIR